MALEFIRSEGKVIDDIVKLLGVPKGQTVIFSRMSNLVWYQVILYDQKVVIDFYPQSMAIFTIAKDDLKTHLRYLNHVTRKRQKLARFKKPLVEAWKERVDKGGAIATIVVY